MKVIPETWPFDKVIQETWRIWWRLFQKRNVFDEGHSRNVTYLMKVILETWCIIRHVTFLEWPSSNTSRFWNNFHQIRHVSGITFIRYVWWRLFQKRDLLIRSFKKRDVSDEGYSKNVTYLMKVIPETRYVTFLKWPSSNTSRFWNDLNQIRHVSGITFIRYVTFLE
jgi:hypothetical protein